MKRITNVRLFVSILILMFVGYLIRTVVHHLDTAFNTPGGKTHNEIMLWHSEKPVLSPKIDFTFEIIPQEDIKLIYQIKNQSDAPVKLDNSIDIAFVDSNLNKIGDPGTLLWRWSKSNQLRNPKAFLLLPHGSFKDELSFNKSEIGIKNSQYYVNFYFSGRFIAQYKVIEGLYNK